MTYFKERVNRARAQLTYNIFEDALLINESRGYDVGNKFGSNPDIQIGSTPEDVWQAGGAYTGQPNDFTPETIDVVSTSANDTSAGTGARTIEIFGLKTNTSTEYESETMTLNGLTPVTSVDSWWRINRIIVRTAGSSEVNEGDITVNSTTTTANIFGIVSAGLAQTQILAFTVPAETTMLIKRIRIDITRINGSSGSAVITLRRRDVGGAYRAFESLQVQTGQSLNITYVGGILVEEGTDLKVTVESVSDNNTSIDGAFEYLLIDD